MCCHQQLVCFNFQCPGTFLLEQKYLYPKKHIGCIMYNLYLAIGSEVEAATSFMTCATCPHFVEIVQKERFALKQLGRMGKR